MAGRRFPVSRRAFLRAAAVAGDPRHVPPPRRQDRDGQHRPAGEPPALAVPGARGSLRRDANVPGGQSVRTLVSAPRIGYQRVNGAGSFWGRGGSASVKDRTLTLTVVNPHATNACETEIAIRGAAPGAVRATTIAASELAAHNTFDQPHSVEPRDSPAGPAAGGLLLHRFPAASVTRLQIALS